MSTRQKTGCLSTVLCLVVFVSVITAQDGLFPYIGKIKPKHASEIQSSNWSVGAETMDRDYTIYKNWKSYLGPLGFKKARLQAGWAKTEKQKGVYNWGWLDEIIFDMAQQGVEPWMCLCYGNSIYSGGGIRFAHSDIPQTQDALRAWERFVKAIVVRYKSVIDEWEVWNEPNGEARWKVSARGSNPWAIYADFLIRTAQVIRDVQPNAKILAMSLSGVDYKYASEVLQIVSDRGKLSLIDQITYHPYYRNPDKSYTDVAKLKEVVKKYSTEITLRQGETGCPSARLKLKAMRLYDWSEVSQAKWALRRLLGDLGRDIPSSYFAIMDVKYPPEMYRSGLLKSREDQTVEYPKPAYYALQNLAAVFDNKLRRIPQYSYSANQDISLSVFGYENKSTGAQIVTIWLDGEIPSDSNKKTSIDLTFSNGRFISPVYVDLRTGKVYEIPKANWSRKGSTYKFNAIACYDSPILIADKSNIATRLLQN